MTISAVIDVSSPEPSDLMIYFSELALLRSI
jgi:hypothetical protein